MSLFRIFYSSTPRIKDKQGKVIFESVTSLEKVNLGGIKQCILIRGVDKSNPILLYLHGGPGSTEMALAHAYQKELEKHFTVVNWDQRGAGKSFSFRIPKTTMNKEQFIADALELVLLLKERFNQEKIFLLGHSWGSAFGIELVHKYPEHFHAYVGIGQGVNMKEGERLSYEYALETARQLNNKKAIKQLEKVKNRSYWDLSYTQIQRKWLTKFNGWYYKSNNTWILLKYNFKSPEYNLIDVFKFFIGTLFSLRNMWKPIVEEFNLLDSIKEMKIPVFFIAGRHDYNTPSELVEKFYNQLQAPKKELIWFEESAHSPNYEENEKFTDVLINTVLPLTKGL